MADFAVQRGVATIALSGVSVTITAGVDYTAPASVSAGFMRIVGVAFTGGGLESQDNNGTPANLCVDLTGNITTSKTFTRLGSTGGPIEISWEIIEYTGSIGGDNEFIVRSAETITMVSTSADSGTISGVVTDADVAVFITAVGNGGTGSGRRESEEVLVTSEYIGGSSVARLTRGANVARGFEVSIAVVEFTGSNWIVQREEHTYSAGASSETEAIGTALGSVNKAFIHHQSRIDGSDDAEALGQTCYISSTSQLTFFKQSIGTGSVGVAWIIENTQASGTVMSVEQKNGTRASNVGGDPDSFTQSITAVSLLAESSIMGEGAYTVTGGADLHKSMLTFRLTALDTVTLYRARDVSSRDWRFQVVEWPTAGAAAAKALRLINGGLINTGRINNGLVR